MSSLSVLGFDGYDKKVRLTPDGKAASVFDLIAIASEDTNPRRAWKDLSERFPELVLHTYNYKFPGKGQRETPLTLSVLKVRRFLVP